MERVNCAQKRFFGYFGHFIGGGVTAKGITSDVVNTAGNIRDILGVGRDIESITKK